MLEHTPAVTNLSICLPDTWTVIKPNNNLSKPYDKAIFLVS